MRVLLDGSRCGRWLTWVTLPVVLGLGVIALYPPPAPRAPDDRIKPLRVKTGDIGAFPFPARDQP